MKKASLSAAKAHLSSLVDDAEHRRRRTLILRDGRAVAAIVPVDVALSQGRPLSVAEIDYLFAALGSAAPNESAVDELLSDRR